MDKLEMQFHQAMIDVYKSAKEECSYNATRFLQMVNEHGGVMTAKILINASTPSDGYEALWECGRLDLSVEAVALKSEYAPLFTGAEIERARARLKEYEYDFNL